jgi:hypothetical protein
MPARRFCYFCRPRTVGTVQFRLMRDSGFVKRQIRPLRGHF